ncbi:SIR2 family protein (plasmid) [Rhodococcus pyridinivorans]|uniref:SIR2 family protein n=1 Tax=Rhodococcus pyridinivorans TaxID=103816 RepID=UPI001FFF0518|nr:SIR2 family protein [Rhodococcus pyridinivorans]UPK66459.1 SIR2 family protein [Rhodococcus pyridinivorans]
MGVDSSLTWDEETPLASVDHRRVEAWLAALLQSERLSLLIGNGLSSAVGHMTNSPPPSMQGQISDSPTDILDNVLSHAESTAKKLGRDSNLEDEIRSAMVLADGLEVLGKAAEERAVRAAIESAMAALLEGVLKFEKGIWDEHLNATPTAKKVAHALLRFLTPFVSRPVQRDRLHMFTTNYDRLLEYAADLLGLRLIDRFEGQLHPRFTASRINLDLHYSPPGVRGEPRLLDGVVRYSKLHGSIDWQFNGHDIYRAPIPFGGPNNEEHHRRAVIYPNPAKDVETLAYPYAELFRDLAAAVCRPNTTLVTFGYGFGDSHINRVIGDMLRVPSTHLVVISRDPLVALDAFKDRTLYPEGQTTELIGPGVGGLDEFSTFLPSLISDRVLDAQFDYLNRRAKLDEILQQDETVDETRDSKR